MFLDRESDLVLEFGRGLGFRVNAQMAVSMYVTRK